MIQLIGGSGLISVYYEKDNQIGEKGKSVDGTSGFWKRINPIGALIEEGKEIYQGAYVKVNNGKLVIGTGAFSNIKFKYELDGWIGRYGMPLEFLLSTHVATMAPDLSYRLATSFNTDVEVLLHQSKKDEGDSDDSAYIKSGVVLKNKDEITDTTNLEDSEELITKDEIDEVLDGEKIFGMSKNDVMKIFNGTALTSPPGCVGTSGDSTAQESSPIAVSFSEQELNNIDKNQLTADNSTLDQVSDVRQTIEATIIHYLDTYRDTEFIDPNKGIQEISMDDLQKILTDELENEGYNEEQAGIIEGTVTNNYTLPDVDGTSTYYSYTPVNSGYATTNFETGSIQEYIHNKIYNEISSEDLIEISNVNIENNNQHWEDDKPYTGWRDYIQKSLLNYYNNPQSIARFINNAAWDKINGSVDGEINRKWFVNVIWNYNNDMESWLEDEKGYDANTVVLSDSQLESSQIGDYSYSYAGNDYWSYEYAGTVYHNPQSAHVWDEYYLNTDNTKREDNDYSDKVERSGLTETWNYDYHIRHNYDDENTSIEENYLSYDGIRRLSSDETDKLFEWIVEEDYDIVRKWDTLQFLDENGWYPWYFKDASRVEFYQHTDKYAAKNVKAYAEKPLMKENNSEWNFSFTNECEPGYHSFITISISTSKSQDGNVNNASSDLTKGELKENNGNYTIELKNNDMGYIVVEFSITKLSDEDIKNATNIGITDTCSSIAKERESVDAVEKENIQCCDVCYNYIKEIYKALKSMEELELTTYVPYINCVTDHWYRNVYFTSGALNEYNSEHQGNEEQIVETDDEYEKATGERWTKYDTYTDSDGNEQYELYVFFKEGDNYKSEFEKDDNGNYIVCRKSEDNTGQYNLNEDGTTYEFVSSNDGEYKLQVKNGEDNYKDCSRMPDEFRVGKKVAIDNDSKYTTNWMAYNPDEVMNDTGWQILDEDNEDLENLNSSIKNILEDYQDLTLVSREKYKIVEQVEDGIRGQTNSTVKKIFLDDYYIYDGTTTRASLIQNAKRRVYQQNKNLDYNDPDSYRELFGNDPIVASYTDGNNSIDGLTATIDQISGKINLTKDSLSAFAMLKNMKTLDSEYIYHDFKELIVELNYFDKEDLVEGETEVMMFPVSGANSEGWIDTANDKDPNFYGTLIHSAQDYEALHAEQETSKFDTLEEEETDTIKRTGNGSGTQFHKEKFADTAQACWEYVVKSNKYSYTDSGCQVPSNRRKLINGPTFVSWVLYEYGYEDFAGDQKDTSYFITTNFEEEFGWEVIDVDANTDLKTVLQKGDIVLGDSRKGYQIQIIADVKDDGTIKVYDCGKKSNWVSSNLTGLDSGLAISKIIRVDVEKTEEEFEGFEGGEAVVAPVSGQVIDYGTTSRQNIETGETDEVGFIKIRILDDTDTRFVETHIEPSSEGSAAASFLKSNYSDDELDKLGYDYFMEEYQDAGITGNVLYIEGFDITDILEYSDDADSDEENSDTNEDTPSSGDTYGNTADDRGYSNIEINNIPVYDPTTTNVYKDEKSKEQNNKNSTVKNQENINKLVEYIKSDEAPNKYTTQYKVPNLLDNANEFKLEVHQSAKKQAAYTIDVDGKIYIKEGSVIGYTYTEDTAKTEGITKEKTIQVIDHTISDTEKVERTYNVGNYLRMILRDLDDEVVENVENYVETANNTLSTVLPEEFIYYMGLMEEGAKTCDDPDCYLTEDIGDSMGNTTAFGLTYCVDGYAQAIGYTDFIDCLNAGKIPHEEAEDVYIATLEAAKEEILNDSRVDKNKLTSNMLCALVDMRHAGPNLYDKLVDKLAAKGTLSKQDFLDCAHGNCDPMFFNGLNNRALCRYYLGVEDIYVRYNAGMREIIWETETPWSDFIEEHDYSGNVYGWKAYSYGSVYSN